jgi:hypothetical protein
VGIRDWQELKSLFTNDQLNSRAGHLVVFCTYLILTILLTWPLVLHMGSIPSGDGYIYVHSFWLFKKALLAAGNPFHTDYIFYPEGVNLVFNGGVFSSFLMTLPATLLWGIPEAINCSHVISFTLSGYFVFLLCLEMTASPAASFLAGVIYAFNPYHFSHFPSQLNLSELEWLPLYLLLLKRALDRKELRWPVLGGICAVACMLTDSIQMIVVVFMSAIVILWQITFARKESGGKDNVFGMVCRLALMLLVFAITSSGYLW